MKIFYEYVFANDNRYRFPKELSFTQLKLFITTYGPLINIKKIAVVDMIEISNPES